MYQVPSQSDSYMGWSGASEKGRDGRVLQCADQIGSVESGFLACLDLVLTGREDYRLQPFYPT